MLRSSAHRTFQSDALLLDSRTAIARALQLVKGSDQNLTVLRQRGLVQLRLIIMVWMIMWVAAVPLFHLHFPDKTDRWSALQSGGAHTVVTPDLPGEYARPFHGEHSGLAQRTVNSPELGIAIFTGAEKNQKGKDPGAFRTLQQFLDTPLLSFFLSNAPEKLRKFQWLQSVHPSRAPPCIVYSS